MRIAGNVYNDNHPSIPEANNFCTGIIHFFSKILIFIPSFFTRVIVISSKMAASQDEAGIME